MTYIVTRFHGSPEAVAAFAATVGHIYDVSITLPAPDTDPVMDEQGVAYGLVVTHDPIVLPEDLSITDAEISAAIIGIV